MRKFAPNFEIIMADLLKTEQQFKDVMSECRTLFEKKLHDYGASWRILRPSSLTDQLYIKAKRIRSLEIKKESLVGEGIRPEFIALINYGIVGLIQLEKPFVDDMLRQARLNLLKDGSLAPVLFVKFQTGEKGVLPLDLAENEEHKPEYLAAVGMTFVAVGKQLEEALMLAESWYVSSDDTALNFDLRPREHPQRRFDRTAWE